jgi:colanic acid biosynthesis glycosyl transferase WcaI
MRILMIVDRYHPEVRSAAHLFQDLAEGLHRAGHQVTVLTKMPDAHVPPQVRENNPSLPLRERVNGVEVVRIRGLFDAGKSVPLRALDEAYVALRMAGKMAVSQRPDAVVAYSPPLPLAAMAAVLAQLRKTSCVLNLHDIYPAMVVEMGKLANPLAIRLAQMLERLTYRCATQIVVPAKRSREILAARGVAQSKIDLIPNWASTNGPRPADKGNDFRVRYALGDGFVASYAGVMGIYQDIGAIIDCARLMRAEAAVTFVLAGDGVCAEHWKQTAGDLPNVRFIPPLSRDDYHALLDASDACFVPLSRELKSPAIPGKIPSIMAAARPIIAIVPPDKDAAEVIYDSRGGLVVPPGDPAMLERTVRWLHQHPDLAKRLGANGRRYAEQKFDRDRALARFEELILEAIHQRRSKAA